MNTISYIVVWVDPNDKDKIIDCYSCGWTLYSEALQSQSEANSMETDDGFNWIARVVRLNEEFV